MTEICFFQFDGNILHSNWQKYTSFNFTEIYFFQLDGMPAGKHQAAPLDLDNLCRLLHLCRRFQVQSIPSFEILEMNINISDKYICAANYLRLFKFSLTNRFIFRKITKIYDIREKFAISKSNMWCNDDFIIYTLTDMKRVRQGCMLTIHENSSNVWYSRYIMFAISKSNMIYYDDFIIYMLTAIKRFRW